MKKLKKVPKLGLAGVAGIIFEHSPIKCFSGRDESDSNSENDDVDDASRLKELLAALGSRDCKVVARVDRDVSASLKDERLVMIGNHGELPEMFCKRREGLDSTKLVIVLGDLLSTLDRCAVAGFVKTFVSSQEESSARAPVLVLHGVLQQETSPSSENLEELCGACKQLLGLGASDVITRQPRGLWLPHALDESLVRLENYQCNLKRLFEQQQRTQEAQTIELEGCQKRKLDDLEAEMARLLSHVVEGSFLNFPPVDSEVSRTEAQRSIGDWDIIANPLGRGRYARVFQARNRSTNRMDAVKVIMKNDLRSSNDWLFLYNEHESLKRVGRHPNITSLTGAMQSQRCVYFCLELADGSDLFEVLKSKRQLAPGAIVRIFTSISSALAHCHCHATCHRDLKPENVVVKNDYTAKLVDFGCACPRNQLQTQCVGSMPFIAPEFLVGTAQDGAPADVWSLGVVLLEMVFGLHALSRALNWKARKPSMQDCGTELIGLFADPVRALARVRSTLGHSVVFEGDGLLANILQAEPMQRPAASKLFEDPWLLNTTVSI